MSVRRWCCKTHGRRICLKCIALQLGFYVEHFTAEKIPPFSMLTHLLGL